MGELGADFPFVMALLCWNRPFGNLFLLWEEPQNGMQGVFTHNSCRLRLPPPSPACSLTAPARKPESCVPPRFRNPNCWFCWGVDWWSWQPWFGVFIPLETLRRPKASTSCSGCLPRRSPNNFLPAMATENTGSRIETSNSAVKLRFKTLNTIRGAGDARCLRFRWRAASLLRFHATFPRRPRSMRGRRPQCRGSSATPPD